MENDNENLITFLDDTLIDHHSSTTYVWSKGYRRAILDIMHALENNE